MAMTRLVENNKIKQAGSDVTHFDLIKQLTRKFHLPPLI